MTIHPARRWWPPRSACPRGSPSRAARCFRRRDAARARRRGRSPGTVTAAPGTYDVTVTVTDDTGGTAVTTFTIVVTPGERGGRLHGRHVCLHLRRLVRRHGAAARDGAGQLGRLFRRHGAGGRHERDGELQGGGLHALRPASSDSARRHDQRDGELPRAPLARRPFDRRRSWRAPTRATPRAWSRSRSRKGATSSGAGYVVLGGSGGPYKARAGSRVGFALDVKYKVRGEGRQGQRRRGRQASAKRIADRNLRRAASTSSSGPAPSPTRSRAR